MPRPPVYARSPRRHCYWRAGWDAYCLPVHDGEVTCSAAFLWRLTNRAGARWNVPPAVRTDTVAGLGSLALARDLLAGDER